MPLPSFTRKFSTFISELRPSDKAIAGFLAVLLAIGCFTSLCLVVRSFQVAIPAYGGTLNEGVVGSPRFINPLLAASDSDRDLVALTYAGLMGHDSTGKLIPLLAESYTVSPDGTMYTFVLRSNAVFADGSSVTADDVVYTVQKAQDPTLKSPLYASFANIRTEAVDARTIQFILPKAYSPFLEDTTLGILPQHIWQSISDQEFPFASYSTTPIGAGPFIPVSLSRDENGAITSYSLKANKNFVNGRPYLSHIRFTYYQSQADLKKALADGKVSSAYGIASENARSVPYARVFGVFFNSNKNSAFEDSSVRNALSLAVDRTAIATTILGGYATPLNGPLPAGSDVRAVALPDINTHIDDAKKALSDAGYDFDIDSGTWSKGGEKLTVTLDTSNVPELKAVAAEVQKDWQMLGVPTELALHDPNDLTQSVIRPRSYSALLFGEVIGIDPDLYAFWASSERTAPGLNIANYSDKDVDVLLESARAQSDPDVKNGILAEIQQNISAAHPAAFLYTPDFLYTTPASIHGIQLSVVSAPSDRFWDVANWYRYTEHVWPIFVLSRDTGD